MNEKSMPESRFGGIKTELRMHAPFSLFGALTGIVIMAIILIAQVPTHSLKPIFSSLHVMHIVLSAIVTTALFRLYGGRIITSALIGIAGGLGVATISDIVFPHHGAMLVLWATGEHAGGMHLHLAIIDHWYLVIPGALLGAFIGIVWPHTKISHAGHVLLSTWASLFYVLAHSSPDINWLPRLPLVFGILFLTVWVPCCFSDIVFPMIFVGKKNRCACGCHNNGKGDQSSDIQAIYSDHTDK